MLLILIFRNMKVSISFPVKLLSLSNFLFLSLHVFLTLLKICIWRFQSKSPWTFKILKYPWENSLSQACPSWMKGDGRGVRKFLCTCPLAAFLDTMRPRSQYHVNVMHRCYLLTWPREITDKNVSCSCTEKNILFSGALLKSFGCIVCLY